MADWIFQANPRRYDVHAAVAKSRRDWWSTPRFRNRGALHDRVWLQVVGPDRPGIYYVATIVSLPYEKTDAPFGRWDTDIQRDYRIDPPLPRPELPGDPELGRSGRSADSRERSCCCPRMRRLSELASPRLMSLGVQEGLADSGQVQVNAAIEGRNAAVRQELKHAIEALSRRRSNYSRCGC